MDLSRKTWTIIHRVYDAGLLVFYCMLAIEVVVFVAVLLRLPQTRAIAERHRVQEISEENAQACGRLRMLANSADYVVCATVLNDVRANAEKRIADADIFNF